MRSRGLLKGEISTADSSTSATPNKSFRERRTSLRVSLANRESAEYFDGPVFYDNL